MCPGSRAGNGDYQVLHISDYRDLRAMARSYGTVHYQQSDGKWNGNGRIRMLCLNSTASRQSATGGLHRCGVRRVS